MKTFTDINEARRNDTINFKSDVYNKGRMVCANVEMVDPRSGEIVIRAMNNRSIKTINIRNMYEVEFCRFRD